MNIKFNENIEDDVLTNATDIENLDENIGKTGNSSTGDVSEQDKDVAKIQTQHAKAYILRSRREQEY